MSELKSWDELSVLEQMQCEFWDMYKAAYNVRPRGIDTSSWTEEDFEEEFKSLSVVMERNAAEQKIQEAAAVKRFESRVESTIACGARDRETALRWIMEGSECDGDWSYFAYCNGLPYRFFEKA